MSKRITKAMVADALEAGMTVTEAAKHYNVPRSSFDRAAEAFGAKFPKDRPGPDGAADDTRVLSWSCKPSAIAKALEAAAARRAAMNGGPR